MAISNSDATPAHMIERLVDLERGVFDVMTWQATTRRISCKCLTATMNLAMNGH